jgi:hypothetical protein
MYAYVVTVEYFDTVSANAILSQYLQLIWLTPTFCTVLIAHAMYILYTVYTADDL